MYEKIRLQKASGKRVQKSPSKNAPIKRFEKRPLENTFKNASTKDLKSHIKPHSIDPKKFQRCDHISASKNEFEKRVRKCVWKTRSKNVSGKRRSKYASGKHVQKRVQK